MSLTPAERERLRAEIDRVQRGRLRSLQHEPRFPWEGPSRTQGAKRKRELRHDAARAG